MKKYIIVMAVLLFAASAYGIEINPEKELIKEQCIQSRIDDIGTKILNANKVGRRIVFVYDKAAKKSKLKMDTTMTSRRIVLYNNTYKSTENDDEIAAFMSREIVLAAKSFNGSFKGGMNTLQIKAAPKKYEIIADKLAVDLMVNAGYNPLGLITYINKTTPQRRFDLFSNKNLASKRLAIIYEYILTKYPYYLANNTYINNEHYQNFLLTSQENRRRLKEKLESNSKEKIKYE